MPTELESKFKEIVENKKEKEILPFLKKLSEEQKRELVKIIRKLDKYYSEYIETKKGSFSSRGTPEQHNILGSAGFVCYTGSEYAKFGAGWIQLEILESIFEFYRPNWFSNYINERVNKDGWAPFGMTYDWVMDMKRKGILEPSPELIVKTLPSFLFDSIKDGNGAIYKQKNEKLLNYPETLNEHIWLFFEMESDIHWSTQYLNYGQNNKEEVLSWHLAFKEFTNQGKIDRNKIIVASLKATNMNFNKTLTGWFIDLFSKLEPSEAEMLKIQDEMMGVLSCPQTKPVNTILKHFKTLCLNNKFNVDEFLNHTTVLLASETKNITNSALMILDKLARKHKEKINEICQYSAQALLHNDSNIQTRAAKLLAKHGNAKDEELSELILAYSDNLLMESRNLLSEFTSNEIQSEIEEPEVGLEIDSSDVLSEVNKVDIPDNIDDLMFFASQAFDNNATNHFDILPAALLNLNSEINSENINRFEPALQRALKLVTGDWRAGIGNLDHMLAIFFIEYIDIVVLRFPNGAEGLKKIKRQFIKQEEEKRISYQYGQTIYTLNHWNSHCKSRIYEIFKQKLLDVLSFIKKHFELQLLSTPTHSDLWIAPNVLIDRIVKLQSASIDFSHIDLQIALSRVYLNGAEEYVKRVETELDGEIKEQLRFLFINNIKPVKPYKVPSHWWTVAITKTPEVIYPEFKNFSFSNEPREKYTGNYSWRVVAEAHQVRTWDYQKRKTVKTEEIRKELRINLFPANKVKKGVLDIIKETKSIIPKKEYSLYEKIELRRGAFENDIMRFFSICPNNPDILTANLISRSLKYPEFWSEDDKRGFIKFVEQFMSYSNPYRQMGVLLLANGMICSDKTARILVGELWINGVIRDTINSELLGEYLGKFFHTEFAPLKRFTDLITENLFKISSKHDQQLQLLIENMLLGFKDTPIKGLKKLLEIYAELINKNKSSCNNELNSKFEAWKSSKSLTKILKVLA